MRNLHIILIAILIFSLIFNYLSLNSKKTAIQLVNDMGIGYNLGNTYNCCYIIEESNSENEEIKLLGTTFPTKSILREIKKDGFKTIRFQILYNNYLFNNSIINPDLIYKIKELINLINNLNMYLILSIKHKREFWDSEGRNSKDKYINFWKQIANELVNYDEHLIFESMYEIGYLTYLDKFFNYYEDKDYYLSQDFINVIRDSGGFNIDRLLIIPMISSDYELSIINYDYDYNYDDDYKIPKDPYNRLAISLYYYFPCEEERNPLNLYLINLYLKQGYILDLFHLKEWGTSQNYKAILNNFEIMKTNFIDKGFPVIIGEVGILNENIKKDNSIELFLYTIFSMSNENEGILPCLWDIPITSLTNSFYNNFYLNKSNNEWSNYKYGIIFSKISKGKYLKTFDYYYLTNLETEDVPFMGYFSINIGLKKIIKIIVNVRFYIHKEDYVVLTVYSTDKDFSYLYFDFEEKDGKRQYDGTSIFIIDTSELDLCYFIQANAWLDKNYMAINNLTVQYEEAFHIFDYDSYKLDILNEIN